MFHCAYASSGLAPQRTRVLRALFDAVAGPDGAIDGGGVAAAAFVDNVARVAVGGGSGAYLSEGALERLDRVLRAADVPYPVFLMTCRLLSERGALAAQVATATAARLAWPEFFVVATAAFVGNIPVAVEPFGRAA